MRVSHPEEKVVEFLLCGAVQISAWLVGEKDFRRIDHSPGDGHPLLLSTAELGWTAQLLSLKPEFGEHFLRAMPYLTVRKFLR